MDMWSSVHTGSMTRPAPEDQGPSRELRSRLYVFPGGVFEIADYGDDDDTPGFLLETDAPASEGVC